MSGGVINLFANGLPDVTEGLLAAGIASYGVSLTGQVIADITIQREQNNNRDH